MKAQCEAGLFGKRVTLWCCCGAWFLWGGGCAEDSQPEYVDAVTSATPAVREALLQSGAHPGWANPDCTSCHGEVHHSGYRLVDCTLCHGTNGASPQSDKPMGDQCAACHREVHRGLGFAAPKDCRVCHAPASPLACTQTSETEVVVIGAGGGGLAAAAALAQAGKRVVVLEQHYKVGGFMTNFRRGPYVFEASLHGFDGLDEADGLNVELFRGLDIWDRVRPVRPETMYRSTIAGTAYDVPRDLERYRALLHQDFPQEASGVDALINELMRSWDLLMLGMKIQAGDIPPDLANDQDALNKAVGDLTALMDLGKVPVSDFLAPYIQDPELVALFFQLGSFGGMGADKLSALMFVALWNSYHQGGYFYFEGGSQSISDALAEVIEENGGVIELRTKATKIVVKDGMATQVRTADGRCFNTDYVISNASAQATLFDLVGREHWPPEYVQRVEGMQASRSAFVVSLGVDRDYSAELSGAHEVMVTTAAETALDKGYDACDPRDVNFSVCNYSMVDPTAAPKGKNTIVLTAMTRNDCYPEWGPDNPHDVYVQKKEELAQVLLERAEAYLPELRSHIEVMEVGTPVTMEAFSLNPGGAILGWDNTLDQSLFQRLEQKTPIPNLILAGARTFPGAGQSAVLQSGALAALDILQRQ